MGMLDDKRDRALKIVKLMLQINRSTSVSNDSSRTGSSFNEMLSTYSITKLVSRNDSSSRMRHSINYGISC
ncbi:unnamed protein product [Adineta ricciae]|uniref:Uncharacterized protein n=1 Tax=Adineta ricciae TaxID=249248 RepID=A0A815BMM8_ADIRI|nr:unnamed protein product [Adineta ricciae]